MNLAFSPPLPDADRLKSQRVCARGLLTVRRRGGRTRIERLSQEGAAKIRMPRTDADPLEAVLINTAGGLTGGDRLAWEMEAGVGSSLVVTTQASEKVYRASSGQQAETSVRLSVGEGGSVAWLPQETIMFDRAAFSRRLDVELAMGATALIAEATVFGRSAMGERVENGFFRDRWRVSCGGRLTHAEDFFVGPEVRAFLAGSAALGGAAAMATVLLVGDETESWLDRVREIVGEEGGASTWSVGGTGKLLARLYAGDGYGLRKRLVPLLGLLNGRAGLPKCWSL
ncbi:urease accessory protein UreD [Mesorhizobium sp. LHD-90]|uniref:urease accessory protein UreD n=1 Tax=Mesorhizobium sp. LHD-90 TaxID=3071414 RepID=UPI0027DEC2C0|nr:urease accessory protein UreD [Mesorhizobium sp. LHD-90]MDQ6435809.1 urease accessory protein UreD [Mesorhizobium sp. LHD-90]